LFLSSLRSPQNVYQHDLLVNILKYFVCFEGFMDCTFLFLAAEIRPSAFEIVVLLMLTKERVLNRRVPQAFSLWVIGVRPWLEPAKENVLGSTPP
jgi:hypothetical protein